MGELELLVHPCWLRRERRVAFREAHEKFPGWSSCILAFLTFQWKTVGVAALIYCLLEESHASDQG